MTRRDRYILIVVGLVALLGAYWFMALSPKRQQLAKVDKDLISAKQSLSLSQQEKVRFAQAQVQFPTLYASLGRLGKAVPTDEDVPSLLVQLNHAAAKANVDFRSVELKLDLQEKLGATPDASATAAAGASAPAAGATGASGATGAAGATASSATSAPGAAAPATAVPAATLSPLPFQYKFKGDFFHLESLIHNVTSLVQSRNREIAVSGRLVVIQGFSMSRGKVTIIATTYMIPADQGLFGGATPAGPAGASAATPQPASATSSGASSTTPPSAAVTP